MADELFSGIKKEEISLCSKDLNEVFRAARAVSMMYSERAPKIDKEMKKLKALLAAFNKKYSGIKLKLESDYKSIWIKAAMQNEKSIADAFNSIFSKMQGIKSIGADDFGKAEIENQEAVAEELEKAKNMLHISYDKSSFAVELNKNKKTAEIDAEPRDMAEEMPVFKACLYKMCKGKIKKKMDLYRKAMDFGFAVTGDEAYRSGWMPKMDE